MSEFYIENGELYHYGIPGMKWGVRRSVAQLQRARGKLETRTEKLKSSVRYMKTQESKYTAKSEKYKQSNAKYESRIAKASAKKAEYDYKLNKALSKSNPDAEKVAKLTAKSVAYKNEITRNQAKLKFNKWQVKADSIREEARQAELKIKKNEKIMSVYGKTIDAIDNGTIQQGRYFMRYVDD